MTITAKANGLTFSFPDGTTTAQIGEAIDGYFNKQPQETIWTDLKRGTEQLAENYITSMSGLAERLNNPGEVVLHPELSAAGHLDAIHPYSNQIVAPSSITGKVVQAIPSVVASIPGWEIGAERAAALIPEKAPAALSWLAKGVGGTLAGDITSGEVPTVSDVAEGGAANVALETLFGMPGRLIGTAGRMAARDAEKLEAANHVGIEPTLGMITKNPFWATMESAITKMPGAGPLNTARAKAGEVMDSYWRQIRDGMGYQGSANMLGEDVVKSLDEFESDFKNEAEKLYDKVINKVGKYQRINTRKYTRAVEEMGGLNPQPGDRISVPPIVLKHAKALEDMGKNPTNSGYNNVVMGITKARDVLKMLDDHIGTGENADADAAAAKRMAKALRSDIVNAVDALGAGEEWRAAADYYSANLKIIKQAKSAIGASAAADAVYTRLFGGTQNGFTKMGVDTAKRLKATMPELWPRIQAEVVHRMGLANAGGEGLGREFSPANFVTNFKKLTAEEREELFGLGHMESLEQLAKASEMTKEALRHANGSNTAHHMILFEWLNSSANELLHGRPVRAAVNLAGLPLVGRAASLVFSNPAAARAVADASKAATEEGARNRLKQAAIIIATRPEVMNGVYHELQDESKE